MKNEKRKMQERAFIPHGMPGGVCACAPTHVFGRAQNDERRDVVPVRVPRDVALVQPDGGDGIDRRHCLLPASGRDRGLDLLA